MIIKMERVEAERFSSLASRIHGSLEILEVEGAKVISVITHVSPYPGGATAYIYYKEKA